jgi:hypothetical protein
MKHILKNICMIVLTVFFLILLFKNPEISKESINTSFTIWLHNLVPSLFPMIIINDILINYNFPLFISSIFYKLLNKIFKLSFNGTYLFLASLFVGTPANAILIKDFLDKKMLKIEEANKIIYVCYFSNPLFLYNMLSLTFNKYITYKIIITHYIANFIILFLIRNIYIPKNNNRMKLESINLSKLIYKSCQKAINSMLTVLGVISFYMLISNYLQNHIFINGILEISTGLNSLIVTETNYKEILAIIFINFGGLSIFTQIKSILEDTNLNFKNYFKGRLMQVVIGILLFFI